MPPIRQEIRPTVAHLFSFGVQGGDGRGVTAFRRDLIEGCVKSGFKHNYVVTAPGPASRVRSVTQSLYCPTRHFYLLQLSIREECEITSVWRPEWLIGVLCSR